MILARQPGGSNSSNLFTVEEAREHIKEAMELQLEIMKEQGKYVHSTSRAHEAIRGQ